MFSFGNPNPIYDVQQTFHLPSQKRQAKDLLIGNYFASDFRSFFPDGNPILIAMCNKPLCSPELSLNPVRWMENQIEKVRNRECV
jgi:hypothetical protein